MKQSTGVTSGDLVRPSRDGDQFHYHWAARQCLQLLPGRTDLVALTIEGPSAEEADGNDINVGEELIDVGFYFGAEERDFARFVKYVQLKHSTRRSGEPWTASGLAPTINGFALRYAKLIEHLPIDDVARRFRFEFVTNRPIDAKVTEALEDLASRATPRHADLQQRLVGHTGIDDARSLNFFGLFRAVGGEHDLWAQRNLLTRDLRAYLPDADYDAPVQLKELVTRKATTEFASDPSIRQHDVLRALKATEETLLPAPCLIARAAQTLPRQQEQAVLVALLRSNGPLVIHAEGGVGKSVLTARLTESMPLGSEAVLYDCFGDGLYRSALGFRHRHQDALVQIANELAARGLCHPLIPTPHADVKQYMIAFVGRLAQAVALLRARDPAAHLCVIIDAADNAQLAAEERGEVSFVRDLVRAQMPEGVHIALTCRTHRRQRLETPPATTEIELFPFTHSESAAHLRTVYPTATDAEVSEFAVLTSSNPRVQALMLARKLPIHETLKQLGPEPTTVERAIADLLDASVARLKDEMAVEASQMDLICRGLAVLRPLVPISVLAKLSGASESAVRSFALDLGRPLLLKGNSLHFLDEPTETWFRERFAPDGAQLAVFLERLRPLTDQSSYAAAVLPHLLLRVGRLDELVELAISDDNLPTQNPLERRNVQLQRLTLALKACLQRKNYPAAARLALKAGGECAGEERQNRLLQQNTDVAAVLMDPDRIEDFVSRRIIPSTWMGSHHAYHAGLLSGRKEFTAEASSHVRMATQWLDAWARLPEEQRRAEQVSDADIAELGIALLRVRNPETAATFLRGWTPRHHTLTAGRHLGRRLVDLNRFDQLDALAMAAGNDLWLLLGLAAEARVVGHVLPAKALARLLKLLSYRRVLLPEETAWDSQWAVLDGVRSAVELGLRALPPKPDQWAALLRRYLPATPPRTLATRFSSGRLILLRAYSLEAALRGQHASLFEISPLDVRSYLEARNRHAQTRDTAEYLLEVEALLPLLDTAAEVACGRFPPDLRNALARSFKSVHSADAQGYWQGDALAQIAAVESLHILNDAVAANAIEPAVAGSWLGVDKGSLAANTLILLCRSAARTRGLESFAMDLAVEAFESLGKSREDAESRADSYLRLARAILTVSLPEARVFFDRAVEIASRVGDENLKRWAALLHLAKAASVRGRARSLTAYRLSRVAELTREYIERDKHFPWGDTVEALTDLCGSSALAILSRWRDRRFGDPGRLLPVVIYRLIRQGFLSCSTPIALAGTTAGWDRLGDLRRALVAETELAQRQVIAQVAYRYLKVQSASDQTWSELATLGREYQVEFPDLGRLIAAQLGKRPEEPDTANTDDVLAERRRRVPDWNVIFEGLNLTDAAELRAAYGLVRTYDPPYEVEAFFQEAWARLKIGEQSTFVRAVGAWSDFGIFELRCVLKALPSPLPKQLSLREAVREVVLSACQREPTRVHRRGWAATLPFEALHEDRVVPAEEVVQATLKGFAEQVDRLDAGEFFQLIDSVAACLSADDADKALNFGLDLLEEVLQPEDGDGPWRPELQPPESVIGALAGYIWAGLGSPVVSVRWQFAHAVRSVVELSWDELLHAIVASAEAAENSAFVDQGLEFYRWHARQWLLIGLGRGALVNPRAVRPATSLLKGSLRVSHVLLRELAAQALRAVANNGELNTDVGELESVNRSRMPVEVYSNWSPSPDEEGTPGADVVDDEKYYFGIDIGPYWFAALGRSFGISAGSIERRVRHVIREQMGWRGGYSWRNDARRTRKIFDGSEAHHSHGSLPATDDLCAYHAYHGMMLAAAALLQERGVRHRADEPVDDFREWLSRYLLTARDGHWISDRRDPVLVATPPIPKGHDVSSWPWSVTAESLDKHLVTDDGMTVLWGHWTTGDFDRKETVSVRSSLVSRVGAESLVAALQTAGELGRFVLPEAAQERDLATASLSLRAWISDENQSARLDEGDPWANGLRYPGPAPCEATMVRLALIPQANGRAWTNGSNALIRRETWVRVEGYGREQETISGGSLSANGAFVKQLAEACCDDVLVLSVEVRREPSRYARDERDLASYPPPYARYYIMGGDGVVHPLKSSP